MTLDQLGPGEDAVVRSLDSEGPERHRLMDLGLVPGTRIQAVLTGPLGDPTAYFLHGGLVAIRRAQARMIQVDRRDVRAEASDADC